MAGKGTNSNLTWLRQEFLNLRQELLQFRKDSIDNDLKILNHIGDIYKDIGSLKGKMKVLMWGVPIFVTILIGAVIAFVTIFV